MVGPAAVVGGQDRDGASYRRSALYTLCLFEAFPSRGNEKIGGTGYCVTYDTDSQSRNVLASPLGEEGHEVAKGVQANWIHRGAPRPANPVRRHPAKSVCTRVRMIMILDVDVTAEGGITKLIAQEGRYHNPRGRRPVNPHSAGVSKGVSISEIRSKRMYTFSVSYSTCSDHRVTERMRFPVLAYSSRMKVTLSLL